MLAGLVLCFPDKNIGVGVTDENCDSGGNNSTIEAASKDQKEGVQEKKKRVNKSQWCHLNK